MKKILIIALCFFMSGCAHLIIQKDNSILSKTGKIFTRFVIFWPTFSFSEIWIEDSGNVL